MTITDDLDKVFHLILSQGLAVKKVLRLYDEGDVGEETQEFGKAMEELKEAHKELAKWATAKTPKQSNESKGT